MQHPKSSDVKKVIDLFKSVLPKASREGHLNMMEGGVNLYHECGTVHCHGGWYAIAANLHFRRILGMQFKRTVSYFDGANAMAKALGFKHYEELRMWANLNPNIWGNYFGTTMFTMSLAFEHPHKRPYGAKNLQHIIDHWQEVHDRLVILERQNEPVEISEPPVSAEQLISSLENKTVLCNQ